MAPKNSSGGVEVANPATKVMATEPRPTRLCHNIRGSDSAANPVGFSDGSTSANSCGPPIGTGTGTGRRIRKRTSSIVTSEIASKPRAILIGGTAGLAMADFMTTTGGYVVAQHEQAGQVEANTRRENSYPISE